ncbi:hypothetical protein X975_10129, partial [Stegodyphus mimosarum]
MHIQKLTVNLCTGQMSRWLYNTCDIICIIYDNDILQSMYIWICKNLQYAKSLGNEQMAIKLCPVSSAVMMIKQSKK